MAHTHSSISEKLSPRLLPRSSQTCSELLFSMGKRGAREGFLPHASSWTGNRGKGTAPAELEEE